MNPAGTRSGAPSDALTADRARSNPVLAFARLAAFSVWTLYCYCGCRVSRMVLGDRIKKRATSVQWTHRWLNVGSRIVGVRVAYRGSVPPGPALLTPNHLGYFDVLAIGSVCPVVFVSKADVRSWPLLGHFFDMSEHIGVARADRRSLSDVTAAIADRLSAGQRVCVFLEGTSSDGSGLLPFHSSLVQPAVVSGAPVVPVGLNWAAHSDGVCIAEDVAYWRPDHNFVTHAWHALGLRGVCVIVNFGASISPAGEDRKTLAAQSRAEVLNLLGRADARN